jgi:general secretion pathway protein C
LHQALFPFTGSGNALFFSDCGRLSCDVAAVPSSLKLPDSVRTALTHFYERHGRRLPGAISLLMAILLGIALADLVWALIPAPKSAAWRPAPAPATAQSSGRPSGAIDVASIQSANLFGQYNAPADASGNAPPTSLSLKLLGVLASTDNERYSRALIEVAAGDERPFGLGEQVIQGTTLQAILPDRVVLSRGGKLETLRLEKESSSSGGEDYTPPPPPPPAGGGMALSQIRDQILQDPNKAGDYVRVQPANKEGHLHGYRIYPGKDRTIFAQAGLKPGDLVTEVNGVQLDDASKALRVLSDLKDVSQLNLVVERGGQSQTINVKMN